MKAARMSIFFL